MFPGTKIALALLLSLALTAHAQDHNLPIPEGARKNATLGGATTLATGKNYVVVVYDIESPLATVTAFYASRLPGTKQTPDGDDVRYSASEGTIKLARLGAGTRITITVGPR